MFAQPRLHFVQCWSGFRSRCGVRLRRRLWPQWSSIRWVRKSGLALMLFCAREERELA
jgi:hypothetical protein